LQSTKKKEILLLRYIEKNSISIFVDEKEIQRDGKRCEQLAQHLFTLQKVARGILDLPSSRELLQIFGKVCNIL
jgi:hypothetical protein